MTHSPIPPQGSIIQVDHRADSVRYTWHQHTRHPLQWMPMVFGGAMMLQAIGILVIAATQENLAHDGWAAALGFALFGGVGALLFWNGYRKRSFEQIELHDAELIFDNGPTILPTGVMRLVAFPFQLHPFFSNSYANPTPHFRRQIRTIPRENVSFFLERVGERQRLRFDDGRDRVEVGVWLSEPEREWLTLMLLSWQSHDH